MKRMTRSTTILCILCFVMADGSPSQTTYMTESDRSLGKVMTSRAEDWRNGAIVYQVFVDRFAPSAHLEKKRDLYAPPRVLHAWTDVPVPGRLNSRVGLWGHEMDFWGGDLQSLQGKLDYIHEFGADVLYLNPIQQALTNHKYDAIDWAKVSPEYGVRDDVARLAHSLHAKGMKLMLDGVFNHMGRNSPKFASALADAKSPYRDWFFIGSKYSGGYRAWANVRNLPEVRIENPAVRQYLWSDPDSIVQKYLTEGVDGWRLDTAFELGPKFLGELTAGAHHAKPGSAVVGEIWNYPQGWFPALDGVMNFYARRVILEATQQKVSASTANLMLGRMVADCGIEPMLKSWLVLDNHDTDRLRSMLPDAKQRRLAQILQFTLPGCPTVYYGAEVGMIGAGDPGSRGPMRWDLVSSSNEELTWYKKLIAIRKSHRALRIGDYTPLDTDHLIGFVRRTEKTMETVIVLANPSDSAVTEIVSTRDGRIMNGGQLKDVVDGTTTVVYSGMLEVTVPPRSARVFELVNSKGYTPYKRMP
jgi:glycosidase